ncbi:unnamed protein product [Owenia fusiformis]|uniref:Uncharacterized protein n=1 Tax=Owenia fusiformis TaxID=6347 RepID=A0A8J1T5U2_OWEFU|nr:unnamed protein product [Owenia fusiformis]
MGIKSLQDYIETECKDACKNVDLLKISRNFVSKRRGRNAAQSRLSLIIDAESCLDRLYGGYYSDWVCGGQWNRMTEFLSNFMQACHEANMELVVYFNGGLEAEKINQWHKHELEEKKKINLIMRHIGNKGTPPPKVWWVAPISLGSCLRMALRHLGISTAMSMDDHCQEVIAYCRENNFNGIIAEDAEYAIFDPPRYFSSHNLKLTYKGCLESKEFIMDEVAQKMDLHPNRFCVFAALLGNHILAEEDLRDFFIEQLDLASGYNMSKVMPDTIIKAVLNYVRGLASIDDLDVLGKQIFKDNNAQQSKVNKFKQSVQYYLNGTQEGFLKYRPRVKVVPATDSSSQLPGSYPTVKAKPKIKQSPTSPVEPIKEGSPETSDAPVVPTDATEIEDSTQTTDTATEPVESTEPTDTLKDNTPAEKPPVPETPVDSTPVDAPGDTEESEPAQAEEEDSKGLHQGADSVYMQAESGYGNMDTKSATPEIVIDAPSEGKDDEEEERDNDTAKNTDIEDLKEKVNEMDLNDTNAEATITPKLHPDAQKLSSSSSSSSSSSGSSPSRASPDTWAAKIQVQNKKPKESTNQESEKSSRLPPIAHEIVRIASERHQKGLMSAWIYQVISQGEIKIGVTLEDDNCKEIPSAVELYREARQHAYALLFNVRKQKKGQTEEEFNLPKEVTIKEWIVSRNDGPPVCINVSGLPPDWKVPTIKRLWLGQQIEDKNRRLRAFLTCMKSDAPLMLNTSYVPQHLLILCCVLRYMMQYKGQPILRRYELDAILAQSVSPQLIDTKTMQDMKLPVIAVRGVQIGSLVMRGVDNAIFANDACGAPIPWGLTCPWMYFDGKLLHYKLLKATNGAPLNEICDGQVDQVMKVERMRQAILEGLKADFARPQLPLIPNNPYMYQGDPMLRPAGMPAGMGTSQGLRMCGPPGPNMMPAARGRGTGRGHQAPRGPVDQRGGELQIAGVVVGSWGGSGNKGRGRSTHIAPQVTSVGPGQQRRGGPAMRGGGRGGMAPNPSAYQQPYNPTAIGANPHMGTNLQYQDPFTHYQGVSMMLPHQQHQQQTMYAAQQARRGGRGGQQYQQRFHKGGNNSRDITKISLAERTKVSPAGRGRGCTIEGQGDSSLDTSATFSEQPMTGEIGQFMDADNKINGDPRSPDSGINTSLNIVD